MDREQQIVSPDVPRLLECAERRPENGEAHIVSELT